MGLKTTNYEVKDLGIILPEAYAQIVNISTSISGEAVARIAISKSREDIQKLTPVSVEIITSNIDKDSPIYEQMYVVAKENTFKCWEDDIV